MTGLGFTDVLTGNVLMGLAAAAVVWLITRHVQLKYGGASGAKGKARMSKLPDGVTWIGQSSYEVLIAVCDALLPSLSVKECSDEELLKSFAKLGVTTVDDDLGVSLRAIGQVRAYLCAGAVDCGTPKHAAEALQSLISVPEQEQLSLVLLLLSTSVGNFLFSGYPVAFQDLSRSAREDILRSFRESRFETFRSLFQVFPHLLSLFFVTDAVWLQAFKRLVGSLYLSMAEKGKENPAWGPMGYAPDARKDPSTVCQDDDALLLKKLISFEHVWSELIDSEQSVSVDAIVIGSGSGGGVMAHQLVTAGYTVLVVEKGGYFQTADFANWTEAEAMSKCFEKGGLLTSADSNIIFLAGSCVGGGSTMNWSASFRTPDHVLSDWAQSMPAFLKGGRFEASIDAILKLMNVNSDHSYCEEGCDSSFKVNTNNRKLWKGAEVLGYTPEKIPRNVKKCVDCGHCCFGCSHDSKQSTIKTLMEPLLLAQAKGTLPKGRLYVLPDTKVDRIRLATDCDGSRIAEAIECMSTIYKDEGIKRIAVARHAFSVHAKVIISCAGSIQTPPLLIRSGLTNPLIGANLSIHPVLGVGGIYPENVPSGLHQGVSMGVVVREPPVCAPGSPNYQVAIETPPIHCGLMGIMSPYMDALTFKVATLGWKNLTCFVGFARDRSTATNRITVDRFGDPVIHYRVTAHDRPTLLAGVEAMLRITYAGGARMIFVSHNSMPWFVSKKERDAQDKEAFEEYVAKAKVDPIEPFKMNVVTAHHMSSCRMASDPSQGPVSPSGELYDCKNLFVADGSVLPTSLGINPMITIESMAHMISADVIQRLQSFNK